MNYSYMHHFMAKYGPEKYVEGLIRNAENGDDSVHEELELAVAHNPVVTHEQKMRIMKLHRDSWEEK
jgi:hypothetical protein